MLIVRVSSKTKTQIGSGWGFTSALQQPCFWNSGARVSLACSSVQKFQLRSWKNHQCRASFPGMVWISSTFRPSKAHAHDNALAVKHHPNVEMMICEITNMAKTRWNPRTRMPTRILRNRGNTYLSHFPTNPLVGHLDLTHWGDTLVGHSCLTLLGNVLARHSCLTLLLATLIRHFFSTLLLHTLTWHSCKTLL